MNNNNNQTYVLEALDLNSVASVLKIELGLTLIIFDLFY